MGILPPSAAAVPDCPALPAWSHAIHVIALTARTATATNRIDFLGDMNPSFEMRLLGP
jgi:hypothetical protein